jgi:uncharacterized protein YkwD
MKNLILALLFISSSTFAFDAIHLNSDFLTLVNEHREKLGLNPLQMADELIEIGWAHSYNMANGFTRFGHGHSRARCKLAKLAYPNSNLCGENVAFGQEDAREVFDAWINSEEHREAIEEPRFTHTALGIEQRAKDGRMYWTQMLLEIFPTEK